MRLVPWWSRQRFPLGQTVHFFVSGVRCRATDGRALLWRSRVRSEVRRGERFPSASRAGEGLMDKGGCEQPSSWGKRKARVASRGIGLVSFPANEATARVSWKLRRTGYRRVWRSWWTCGRRMPAGRSWFLKTGSSISGARASAAPSCECTPGVAPGSNLVICSG